MRNKLRKILGTKQTSSIDKVPSGTLWPNGEFGLGYANDLEHHETRNEWDWTDYCPVDESATPPPGIESALILSDPSNSRRRGLKGLSGYGARTLRSGAFLMEKKLGKDDVAFWTLTVPTLSLEARKTVAREWPDLVHRLMGQMSRMLERSGRSPAILGCTEIQSGRLEKYKEGYLHLHLICPLHANTAGLHAIEVDELRDWWKRAVERKIRMPLAQTPRVQVEAVRESVEAYLGKYLSKGDGDALEGFIEDLGEESVPATWWHATMLVKNVVKERTTRGGNTGAILEALIQQSFEDGNFEAFEFIRHVDLLWDGKEFTVGWYGKLRDDVSRDLQDMLAPLECKLPVV